MANPSTLVETLRKHADGRFSQNSPVPKLLRIAADRLVMLESSLEATFEQQATRGQALAREQGLRRNLEKQAGIRVSREDRCEACKGTGLAEGVLARYEDKDWRSE